MNPNHSTKMKKSMIIHGAAAAIALLTMATPAGAVPVPIPIANAGFENPVLADGAYTSGTIVGWITSQRLM